MGNHASRGRNCRAHAIVKDSDKRLCETTVINDDVVVAGHRWRGSRSVATDMNTNQGLRRILTADTDVLDGIIVGAVRALLNNDHSAGRGSGVGILHG